MGSLFGCCCPFGEEMKSLADGSNSLVVSPIVSLDSYIADWAYVANKRAFKAETSRFSCKKYPKKKDLNFTVSWNNITFTHHAPKEFGGQDRSAETAAAATAAGSNETETPLLNTGSQPKDGFDSRNKMTSMHQDTFSVTFDNTTDDTCDADLSAERTVKSVFEVDVHKSIQTGHNLQLALELGGEASPAKMEASYEFNKMLENYEGEKKTEEMETKLHTSYPVKVQSKHTTEARFVTTYQNFKKKLEIASEFSGTINVAISGKKNIGGNKFYRTVASEVSHAFRQILNSLGDCELSSLIKVDYDNQIVRYSSSATFCSSFGVVQNIKIVKYPIGTEPPKDV